MRSTVGATLSAVACAVALSTGCTDDIGGPPGPGPDDVANLTVRLTDAPGDIQSAVVTITEINLQGGSNGPVVVSDDPITLDLVELADSAATIVNAAEVPADTYQELRFVISGGFLVVEDVGGTRIFASSPTVDGLPDGTVPDGILVMPSLGQSGLKVSFDTPLVITGSTDLLIDFDVSQSFGKEAGNSGRWVMSPVVRGGQTTEAGTIMVSAALSDSVTLPTLNGTPVTLADFQAQVGGETKALVDDGAGNFQASFGTLLPGTFDVRLVPPQGVVVTTDLTMPVQVDLAAGGTETVAFIITGVQATDTTGTSSITVSADLADTVTLPTLNGTPVTLADFQAQVGTVMQPLVDDGAGNFQASFSALSPGTHDVSLVPPASLVITTDLTMPVPVTLASGDSATVAFIITGVQAADTTSTSSITVSAALADTVTLPTLNGTPVTLADFQAQVGTVMQPLVDDGAGNFQVSFSALPSGTHDVRLVPPAGVVFTTDLTMPVMVTLAPGDTATVAFIITSAAASGS